MMDSSPLRRLEDQLAVLLHAAPAGQSTAPLELEAYEFRSDLGEELTRISVRAAESAQEVMFLLDPGTDELILLTGAELRRIPKPAAADTPFATVGQEALALRRRQLRSLRRQLRSERFLLLSERLNRATTVAAVVDAVVQHAPSVVGGCEALLFLRQRPAQNGNGELHAEPHPHLDIPLEPLALERGDPTLALGLINRADLQDDSPLSVLRPLFDQVGADRLAFVSLNDGGLLVVVERRREREFEGEDWYRLQSVAHEVAAALERIGLAQDVQALDLIDPDTGLGNRRRLEAWLQHAVPAVARGIPLTLVALTPETRPDREDLRAFAHLLRGLARASDLVARYDEEVFVVALSGTRPGGADALLGRLRAELRAGTELRTAVLPCLPHAGSPRDLVEQALARLQEGGALPEA